MPVGVGNDGWASREWWWGKGCSVVGFGFAFRGFWRGRRRKVRDSMGRNSAGLWGDERIRQSTIKVEPPKERAEPARVVMVGDEGIRLMGGIPEERPDAAFRCAGKFKAGGIDAVLAVSA